MKGDPPMVFLVMLKTDGGGTAVLACTSIRPDPVFPTKVILENIQALSWPFQGMFMHVQNWSVERELVVDWKAGPLEKAPIFTREMLAKGGKLDTPHTPNTQPSLDLGDPKVLREALEQQAAELEKGGDDEGDEEDDEATEPPPTPPKASTGPRIMPISVPG